MVMSVMPQLNYSELQSSHKWHLSTDTCKLSDLQSTSRVIDPVTKSLRITQACTPHRVHNKPLEYNNICQIQICSGNTYDGAHVIYSLRYVMCPCEKKGWMNAILCNACSVLSTIFLLQMFYTV